MSDLHDSIGGELQHLGGVLRCHVCGLEKPLASVDVGRSLRDGWPRCHQQTMEWITERQLRAEASGGR